MKTRKSNRAKQVDASCGNNKSCPWCLSDRTAANVRAEPVQQLDPAVEKENDSYDEFVTRNEPYDYTLDWWFDWLYAEPWPDSQKTDQSKPLESDDELTEHYRS